METADGPYRNFSENCPRGSPPLSWRIARAAPWGTGPPGIISSRVPAPTALLQGLLCVLPGPRYSAQKSWQEGP